MSLSLFTVSQYPRIRAASSDSGRRSGRRRRPGLNTLAFGQPLRTLLVGYKGTDPEESQYPRIRAASSDQKNGTRADHPGPGLNTLAFGQPLRTTPHRHTFQIGLCLNTLAFGQPLRTPPRVVAFW